MKKRIKRSYRLLAALLLVAALLSRIEGALAFAEEELPAYELPILSIESEIGADGSTDYESAAVTVSNTFPSDCLERTAAVWKIHGRSSARSQKKSFNLKFEQRVDLLGMGAAKKWILIANPYDKTMLRNKLMYDLSASIGMSYPIESQFVELYINGVYRGVYQVCEAPEIDRERVAINPAKGEFLLELLLNGREATDPVITTPYRNLRFLLNSIDYLPPDQRKELKQFFDGAEKALISGKKDQIAEYFDLDSMVNGYILFEFSKNADLAIGSTRFVIKDGKIHAGPAWDFDLSCGNDAFYCDPLHLVNGTRPAVTDGWYAVQLWYRDLIQMKWFREMFAERYLELQPVLINLYEDNELGKNQIDTLTEAMSGAIAHNYSLWSVHGNESILARSGDKTYAQNVTYLKNWLRDRNNWIVKQVKAGKGPYIVYGT